jgi:VWFA-related protein
VTLHSTLTRRLALAVIAGAAAVCLRSLPPAVLAAPPQGEVLTGTRHLYLTALDRRNDPVRDLTAADVVIKEDNAVREIVTLEPARTPIQLALLVDDTGPGINFIREGVNQFLHRMQGRAEVALVSTGGRNTLLVDFTRDMEELMRGVRSLTTRVATGAYLLDAIREAVKVLRTREAIRPVIVVLTLEGEEFSNVRPDLLLGELQRSRATLHVVSLGRPTLKTMTGWNQLPSQAERENLDENINRKKVLQEGSKRSGGRVEQVLVDSGIPTMMLSLADELLHQYVVVYRRPETPVGPRKVTIQVKRSGVKVRARAEVS